MCGGGGGGERRFCKEQQIFFYFNNDFNIYIKIIYSNYNNCNNLCMSSFSGFPLTENSYTLVKFNKLGMTIVVELI